MGVVVVMLVAGCGDEKVAPVYVGKVAESDAVVAAVSDGEHVAFYLCGGAETYATHTRWFKGAIDEGGAFSIENDGFVAKGDLTSQSGTVKIAAGETWAWSLRPAEGEIEGLYEAMDGSCRTGAVAADFDGDGVVDLQGTWCDGQSRFAQVTPITPVAVTDRGIGVSVQILPSKALWVDRVRSP